MPRRQVSGGVPAEFHDFTVAAASTSAALIGPLFVAVSVFPDKGRRAGTRVEYLIQASSALIVLLNAFLLSLAFLVPGSTVGAWAVVGSLMLFVFIAATTRVLAHAARTDAGSWDSMALVFALLAVDAVKMYAGISTLSDTTDTGHLSTLNRQKEHNN